MFIIIILRLVHEVIFLGNFFYPILHLKSEEKILIVSKKIPQNRFFQHRL
jgi:hypothetical protein